MTRERSKALPLSLVSGCLLASGITHPLLLNKPHLGSTLTAAVWAASCCLILDLDLINTFHGIESQRRNAFVLVVGSVEQSGNRFFRHWTDFAQSQGC